MDERGSARPLVPGNLIGTSMIVGGLVSILLWYVGRASGDFGAVDRIAMPMVVLGCFVGGVLTLRDERYMQASTMSLLLMLAAYLAATSASTMPTAAPGDQIASMAMTYGWLPFVYTGLFMASRMSVAIALSFAALLALSFASLPYLDLSDGTLRGEMVYAVVNYLLAHFVTIGMLTGFGALRRDYLRTRDRIPQLVQEATRDVLTDLTNRGEMLARLQASASFEGSPARAMSVILIDLDHFKSINDTHGHGVGDQVLRRLADLLRDSMRPTDEAARWGGEEFLVFASRSSATQATAFAERLLQKMRESSWPLELAVTASFGVAALRPGESPLAAVARADAAMYQSKAAGRARVMVAPEDRHG